MKLLRRKASAPVDPCPHALVRWVTVEDWLRRPYRNRMESRESPCVSERGHYGYHKTADRRSWA